MIPKLISQYVICGFAAISILLFSDCKKKNVPAAPEPVAAPVEVNRITFGNTENLHVNTISSTFADVDEDGTNDLELRTEFVKNGPGPSAAPQTSLVCLNPQIEVRSVTRTDTIFSLTSTTYTSAIYLDTSRVVKNISHQMLCTRMPGAAVSTVTAAKHFVGFKSGESADINQEFSSASLIVYKNGSSTSYPYQPVRDTMKVEIYSTLMDCKQDLNKTETFFCFKLSKNGAKRIGWIQTSGTSILRFAVSR